MIKFHLLLAFGLKERNRLRKFLTLLFNHNGKSVGNINYIFCTDDYLLELNKRHLHHNTLTDIITFELSQEEQPLVSDIYISIERVRENARLYKATFNTELHRVIFHGALHLCGYKDKTPGQVKQMRLKEDESLSRYFVSRESRK